MSLSEIQLSYVYLSFYLPTGKHKRIRLVEERALAQVPVVNENHHSRDPERGS